MRPFPNDNGWTLVRPPATLPLNRAAGKTGQASHSVRAEPG